MSARTAILVDDVAADRQLAARVLRHAGWTIYAARTTIEGDALLQHHATGSHDLLVITDLHMPADPAHRTGDRTTVAGAHWALQLRAQMERAALPRLPVVAFTALTQQEIHLTALAFGCDAVVPKPVTPDLAQRIEQTLQQLSSENDPVGSAALLGLLRYRLADALAGPTAPTPLTEHDLTRALLAYRRRGLVGLGESTLAGALAPHLGGILARGDYVHALLLEHLDAALRLNAFEAMLILQGELVQHATPAERSAALGLSLSEYYRRRREAISVLSELLLPA